MENYKSKVYVRIDSQNRIIAIDGGYTIGNIKDFSGWMLIDEGNGDKYNLCQGNYLSEPLLTEDGLYRWELINNQCVLRSQEALEKERKVILEPKPTQLDIIEAQIMYTALMTDTLLEE